MLSWKKIRAGVYHATSPWGLYTIDGEGAGRNRWTVTYPDSDYGMVDSLAEAKAWAAQDAAERAAKGPAVAHAIKRRMFLPLSTIARYEAIAKKRGVSEVARGPSGFLPAYKRAGSSARMPDYWKSKREGFIARHMAQLEERNEPLWDPDGSPSRRHLALIMWAYSPAASKL
ncbi:MAG TPA: hypothetical protein VLE97_11205 [Gaiellaceae bacterium]|nr:hypothetical protein [Gaiellaceae bacterium]